MAMFYGTINIAAVNALVIYAKKHQRRSAWEKDIKEILFAQIYTRSGGTICNMKIQTLYTT
jgi:hypothetical protein